MPTPDFITPEGGSITAVRYHDPMHQTLDNAHQTLRRWVVKLVRSLLWLSVIALVLVVAYFFAAYHFAYSRGESVGYVQKISHKGWVCKTWEGEQVRALAAVPAVPEKCVVSVRDASVVDQINAHIGQRVVLEYAFCDRRAPRAHAGRTRSNHQVTKVAHATRHLLPPSGE